MFLGKGNTCQFKLETRAGSAEPRLPIRFLFQRTFTPLLRKSVFCAVALRLLQVDFSSQRLAAPGKENIVDNAVQFILVADIILVF